MPLQKESHANNYWPSAAISAFGIQTNLSFDLKNEILYQYQMGIWHLLYFSLGHPGIAGMMSKACMAHRWTETTISE